MSTIRFDKFIDHYLSAHEGTHFHPSATQKLNSVLGVDGYLHIGYGFDYRYNMILNILVLLFILYSFKQESEGQIYV